jgi:NitT/TauT family transport system substrate-binding protein
MLHPLRYLALLLTLALLPGCGRPPEGPFQVATNVWPGYEPFFLARQMGELPPEDFRLVEMSDASDCLRALQAGRVSAATLTLDETFTLLQEGEDLQVVLVLDISNGADVLLGRPGVNSLAELKGRRIGAENTAVGAYMLSRALERAGLYPGEVEMVPVTMGAHEAAFQSGAVDAIVTYEPNRTRLLAGGAQVLFDSSQIPNEIFDVLVVRGEAARTNPAAVARLQEAWFKTLAYIHEYPQESARRMAPREGLEPEAFRMALKGLSFPDAAAEAQLRKGDLLAPARRLADLMLRKRLLAHPVDPSLLLPPSR